MCVCTRVGAHGPKASLVCPARRPPGLGVPVPRPARPLCCLPRVCHTQAACSRPRLHPLWKEPPLPTLRAAAVALCSEGSWCGLSLLPDRRPAHCLSLLLGPWTRSPAPGRAPCRWQSQWSRRPPPLHPHPIRTLSRGSRPKPGQQRGSLYSSYNKPPLVPLPRGLFPCASVRGHQQGLRAAEGLGGLGAKREDLGGCQGRGGQDTEGPSSSLAQSG